MTKLIIWDLDDTLWKGTLAEGDEVELILSRADAIKQLNLQGVVHSICSKNDPRDAERKLEDLGLKDEFVFSEISFEPKGFRVHRIVKDMNLRFQDVVFVDDNPSNLEEVRDSCEGIVVLDARDESFDGFLAELLQKTSGGKSRVDRYRILERKREDRAQEDGSNEDFLRKSEIHVCFLRMSDNLPHAERIEELINRTNQLNFLKTRVKHGEISEMLVDPTSYESSVFVWDKYGNYGLVGFGAIGRQGLKHFTFSCRTMHMGIENSLAWSLKTFRAARRLSLPVEAFIPDWITVVDPDDETAVEKIREATDEVSAKITVRIMANCQSAAIAHYMKSPTPIAFDNWPRTFTLGEYQRSGDIKGEWYPQMVYGAFVDYLATYWPDRKLPSLEEYELVCSKLVNDAVSNSATLTVLLPVEEFSGKGVPDLGVSPAKFAEKNQVWRKLAESNSNLKLVDLSVLNGAVGTEDPRHLTRDQLMELSVLIRTVL